MLLPRRDMETKALTLTEFLLARIAEDETAAKAVPTLGHNYDMGGNRQDERWVFDRTLPSSADGMGNWSEHRHSPTTRAHFTRWDPARVLAECEAKRRIVEELGQPRLRDAAWMRIGWGDWLLRTLAAVYADHPDYRDEWSA